MIICIAIAISKSFMLQRAAYPVLFNDCGNVFFCPMNLLVIVLGVITLFQFYNKSKKVKLATIVEGDQKSPFSISTTSSCRGGRYSFLWIAPLYPLYVPYIAEC